MIGGYMKIRDICNMEQFNSIMEKWAAATRAGDAGVGFSVVAREVEKLSALSFEIQK